MRSRRSQALFLAALTLCTLGAAAQGASPTAALTAP
jgi:hypothetical protein